MVGNNKTAFHVSSRIVYGVKQVAENVQSILVPNSGHWIVEEQSQFLIKNQLSNFVGNNISITPAATLSSNGTTGDTTALYDRRTASLRNLLGE
ncbi:MAG TPA: hypothetical protein VGE97_01860 [Nitrososphaera sp.]|jgi:hypothetical protein